MLTDTGVTLAIIGLALLLNLRHSADWVIAHVTSKDLGSLAPGYAASRTGFKVYAAVVVALGAILAGLGLATKHPAGGGLLIAAGALGFVIGSIVIVAGEVSTYRALPKGRA